MSVYCRMNARARVTTDPCSGDLGRDARRCSCSGGELFCCSGAGTGRDDRPDRTGGAARGAARRGRRGTSATAFPQRGGPGPENFLPARRRFRGRSRARDRAGAERSSARCHSGGSLPARPADRGGARHLAHPVRRSGGGAGHPRPAGAPGTDGNGPPGGRSAARAAPNGEARRVRARDRCSCRTATPRRSPPPGCARPTPRRSLSVAWPPCGLARAMPPHCSKAAYRAANNTGTARGGSVLGRPGRAARRRPRGLRRLDAPRRAGGRLRSTA